MSEVVLMYILMCLISFLNALLNEVQMYKSFLFHKTLKKYFGQFKKLGGGMYIVLHYQLIQTLRVKCG